MNLQKVSMFKSKKLSDYNKSIVHAFFNSQGGVSTGIYKGLNCGLGSKDKKTNIKKNLNIVKKKIKCKHLILLYIHRSLLGPTAQTD